MAVRILLCVQSFSLVTTCSCPGNTAVRKTFGSRRMSVSLKLKSRIFFSNLSIDPIGASAMFSQARMQLSCSPRPGERDVFMSNDKHVQRLERSMSLPTLLCLSLSLSLSLSLTLSFSFVQLSFVPCREDSDGWKTVDIMSIKAVILKANSIASIRRQPSSRSLVDVIFP